MREFNILTTVDVMHSDHDNKKHTHSDHDNDMPTHSDHSNEIQSIVKMCNENGSGSDIVTVIK